MAQTSSSSAAPAIDLVEATMLFSNLKSFSMAPMAQRQSNSLISLSLSLSLLLLSCYVQQLATVETMKHEFLLLKGMQAQN
jgi:hypothetical protein